MKIKKVEEKPMVLHTKKKPKLHIRKKEQVHGQGGKRNRLSFRIKSRAKESAKSVKVKNQKLHAIARTGAKVSVSQIEGGEEIKDSVDLAVTLRSPVAGIASVSQRMYRRKKHQKTENKKNDVNLKKDETGQILSSQRKKIKAKDQQQEGTKRGKKSRKEGKASGKKGGTGSSIVKSKMIDAFLEKFRLEQEEQKGLITSTKEAMKAAVLLLAQKIMVAVLPLFLAVFGIIAIVGVIVVAILAVIYNSPLAIFFPLPDTGYENPKTVLSEYYKEFNEEIIRLEGDGNVITYQNMEDGVPVSNFNDTLMVYMVKYSTGQAGYVMDEEGKKNLKKVFDEMNYMDAFSDTVKKKVGDSIGEVYVTAYCPCSLCCGKYANGITASGKKAKPKHTIAVDAYHPIVPMGTKVIIEGVEYTVEDTGDLNHYGNDFDIFYASHSETSQWGRKKVEAFLAEGNSNTVEVQTSSTVVHNLTYEDYIAKGTLSEEETEFLREMMSEDMWDSYYDGVGGQVVAELAMTKIGCRYSQDKRYEEGYYDCSSLVQRLYKEVGYKC